MSTQHVNDGVIGIVFSLVYVSLKKFGVVGSDTCTWGIKGFHKCWSGSLAKRRLCLGPTGVINCTPLSALSFWVSLFPRTRGYNNKTTRETPWKLLDIDNQKNQFQGMGLLLSGQKAYRLGEDLHCLVHRNELLLTRLFFFLLHS